MRGGILLLDKPLGLSSNAALQRVRSLFGRIKAGHVGSLDPLASGMLPICLGEATKIAGDILAGRKCYRFSVRLGTRTATGDTEGAVLDSAPVPALGAPLLEATLTAFLGASQQIPPMYSAVKQGGTPLYRLARAGQTVERPPREIRLDELRLIGHSAEVLELETLCSKGTYVRVLAEDIAARLGTLGHVCALRRVYVEPFAGQPMHTLEGLAGAGNAAHEALLPIDWPLSALPQAQLPVLAVQRLRQGQRVRADLRDAAERVRLYDAQGEFLGIGQADGSGLIQPRRLLN
jgi:tRNA pseudouridine55 synthase